MEIMADLRKNLTLSSLEGNCDRLFVVIQTDVEFLSYVCLTFRFYVAC